VIGFANGGGVFAKMFFEIGGIRVKQVSVANITMEGFHVGGSLFVKFFVFRKGVCTRIGQVSVAIVAVDGLGSGPIAGHGWVCLYWF
jgi:hypothetical protein